MLGMMENSNAVAARFLRAVVTGVEGVLPGHVRGELMKTGCVEFTVDGLQFEAVVCPEVDLKTYSKYGWYGKDWCNGRYRYRYRYRCRLLLPFPLAANGFGPSAQREHLVSENVLQKVAAEFAGLVVAAVEASKRERGPRLVVDNTVGSEA